MLCVMPTYSKDIPYKTKPLSTLCIKNHEHFFGATKWVNLDNRPVDDLTAAIQNGPSNYRYDLARLMVLKEESENDDVCYMDDDVLLGKDADRVIYTLLSSHYCFFVRNPGTGIFVKKGYGHMLDPYIDFYKRWAALMQSGDVSMLRKEDIPYQTDCNLEYRFYQTGRLALGNVVPRSSWKYFVHLFGAVRRVGFIDEPFDYTKDSKCINYDFKCDEIGRNELIEAIKLRYGSIAPLTQLREEGGMLIHVTKS